MRVADRHRVRPLLGVRRATTAAACAALGLPVWTDPHNADDRFQRVRLRSEVLPLLEEILQGGVAEALARTAGLIRDDLDALDAVVPVIAPGPLEVDILLYQPSAIRARVLKRWAEAGGAGALTAAHVAELDRLIVDWHGQGPIPLPGAASVRRASGTLWMSRQQP